VQLRLFVARTRICFVQDPSASIATMVGQEEIRENTLGTPGWKIRVPDRVSESCETFATWGGGKGLSLGTLSRLKALVTHGFFCICMVIL